MLEHKLFRVLNTTASYPQFYVQATSLVEAAELAHEIVKTINDKAEVTDVGEVTIRLLTMEYRHDQ